MLCGMIANEMSLFFHTQDKIGVAVYEVFQNEKRALDLMLFQGVENSFHVAVFVSRVEREINDFFIRIFADKKSVFFFNIRHIRIDARSTAVFFTFTIPILRVFGIDGLCMDENEKERAENANHGFQ
jgi:hypothetical protein